MRWRLGPRPLERQVLAHDELEGADEPGLDGRHTHLAVPLHAVTIAHREERLVDLDGQKKMLWGERR